VTPDSFSDGGRFDKLDAALRHTEQMIEEGASIIDIGGESTRPGYTKLSDEEEIARVVPVIKAVKAQIDIPVSIDTYKPAVAAAAVEAGADMINDIWGLKADPKMAEVIAASGLPCCLMHNRETTEYNHFLTDVLTELEQTLEMAQKAGISYDKIMIDPGIGFGKTYEQNLEMMANLEELHTFGLPVLLAASRKSVIGLTLDLDTDQRLEGTIATSVIGVMKGCSFVRVHDVKENLRAVKMALAVRKAKA
jgi:dihydropteroate synthase